MFKNQFNINSPSLINQSNPRELSSASLAKPVTFFALLLCSEKFPERSKLQGKRKSLEI